MFMRTLVAVAAIAVTLASLAQTPPATGAPDKQFTERIRQADTNGDGVISEAEARAAGLWFTQDLGSADTDHSGTVTLFEFGQALQQRLNRWLSDLASVDTNHDGVVTQDEARRVPGIAEAFTTIDRNKDRAVSRDEYDASTIDRIYRSSELPSVAPNIIEKRF
jgi:Ca2+-binding EF-hand superfamily protein